MQEGELNAENTDLAGEKARICSSLKIDSRAPLSEILPRSSPTSHILVGNTVSSVRAWNNCFMCVFLDLHWEHIVPRAVICPYFLAHPITPSKLLSTGRYLSSCHSMLVTSFYSKYKYRWLLRGRVMVKGVGSGTSLLVFVPRLCHCKLY